MKNYPYFNVYACDEYPASADANVQCFYVNVNVHEKQFFHHVYDHDENHRDHVNEYAQFYHVHEGVRVFQKQKAKLKISAI